MFIILICSLFSSSISRAASDGLVRIQKKDAEAVFQGQKVSFYIQLLSAGLFSGSPRFELPELSDGLLFQVPGSSIQGTETVDGTSYASQLYEFWFFPKQQGSITVPAISTHFTTSDYLKENIQTHDLATEPFAVEVKPIPGAPPDDNTIVVTSEFKAQQSWDPVPADTIAGAAFTRIIRMEAKDTASIFLPELVFNGTASISIYPKQPELSDANQRGEATGYRTEAVTYLFEHEGRYSLPEVRLVWFNLGRGQLEEIVLDGAEVTIAADPSQPQGARPQASPAKGKTLYLAALALFSLVFAAVWFRRPILNGISRWQKQRKERYLQSEKAGFDNLVKACKAGKPLPAYNKLYFWLRKKYGNEALTLVPFVREKGDISLGEEASSLDAVLFSPTDNKSGPWSGQALLRQLIRFRKSNNHLGTKQAHKKPFTALNE